MERPKTKSPDSSELLRAVSLTVAVTTSAGIFDWLKPRKAADTGASRVVSEEQKERAKKHVEENQAKMARRHERAVLIRKLEEMGITSVMEQRVIKQAIYNERIWELKSEDESTFDFEMERRRIGRPGGPVRDLGSLALVYMDLVEPARVGLIPVRTSQLSLERLREIYAEKHKTERPKALS